jgi:hypothetical protein
MASPAEAAWQLQAIPMYAGIIINYTARNCMLHECLHIDLLPAMLWMDRT